MKEEADSWHWLVSPLCRTQHFIWRIMTWIFTEYWHEQHTGNPALAILHSCTGYPALLPALAIMHSCTGHPALAFLHSCTGHPALATLDILLSSTGHSTLLHWRFCTPTLTTCLMLNSPVLTFNMQDFTLVESPVGIREYCDLGQLVTC